MHLYKDFLVGKSSDGINIYININKISAIESDPDKGHIVIITDNGFAYNVQGSIEEFTSLIK